MIRLSKYQLFCLIVLFEIGSSILFVRGIEAKQDAWLAVLIGMTGGFGLMWIYTQFHKIFPEKNLAEMIISILGKNLGMPLVFFYGLFFLYTSVKNFHEFGLLLNITFLPHTPKMVILAVFMLTALYILFLGVEVLARTSEFSFPILLFFLLSVIIMIVISGKIELSELRPVLAKGWQPILREVYPGIINFPFGEAVVFIMYWHYLDPKQSSRTIALLAFALAGLTIALVVAIDICVLGVNIAANSTISFLEVIKAINIGGIITNLDAFGITLMFIGGFYKMIIFFWGGIQAFATLFKKTDLRIIILACAIFDMWMSIDFEPSFPFHVWSGLKIAVPYIHNVFQTIIPPILLLICWLQQQTRRKNNA